MADRTSCVNCGRPIDAYARVCPYCNWWQSQPVPARQPAPPPVVAESTPAVDPRTRNTIVGLLTFGFLMMVAFTIGAFLRGSDAANAASPKEPQKNAATEPAAPLANVTLVPVTEGQAAPVMETPITSVAPTGATITAEPSDATAMPSNQYAAAAARMRAAQQAEQRIIDPRSLTGQPYVPARPAPRPRQVAAVQTEPVPLSQPVPRVRVVREETVQLSLLVGTDGRVHDVDIHRGAPDVMGPLIGSVQQWRFRPAMQNGEPVTSRFMVAVTFKP